MIASKSSTGDYGNNPFSTNVPLLYPLKTSENLSFSDVFRRYRSGALVEHWISNDIGMKNVSESKTSYIIDVWQGRKYASGWKQCQVSTPNFVSNINCI